MYPALTIVDNLLGTEKALEVREKAIDAGFRDVFFMGGKYQGSGVDYKPDEIPLAISEFLGRPVDVKIQAFRLGHEETDLHVNIHADNPISTYAAVYYLNLPEDCKGGTAFYDLKETGWDRMPTQPELENIGKDMDWMRDKWQKEEEWNIRSIAGMKFDRLIFYPSLMFHSRFPLKGWGKQDDPQHARLVHTMFFNIA